MNSMKHYLTPPTPTEAVYYTPQEAISEIEVKTLIKNPEWKQNNYGKENIRKENNG